MKTKINKNHKIKVITLGCSKNIVDSEMISYQVKAANFQINPDPANNDADIVIINTCGFIKDAKQESIDTILNYVNLSDTRRIFKFLFPK
jgi:ribosomal protein S12 methylthiotransferase